MFDLFFPYLSSDADRLGVWGLAAAMVALTANVAERRRMKRARLDRVGVVPWTPIFLLSFLAAVILLGFAVRGWLNPA
jgi:hypothetical protein